jgi:general secretion pathway protein G
MQNRTKQRRARQRQAFTLIEVIVVVIIIGVLAAAIAPRLIGRIGQSKQAVGKLGATELARQLQVFMLDTSVAAGSIPDLTVLWERPQEVAEDAWQGPYVNSAEDLLDPWGNPYILLVPGEKNFDFDVISYGADGQQGGSGEAADIVHGK